MTKECAKTVCEVFNENWPVGSDVIVVHDLGAQHVTKTRSVATVKPSGPVVWVEGEAGYHKLERVIPLSNGPSKQLDEIRKDLGFDELRKKFGHHFDDEDPE